MRLLMFLSLSIFLVNISSANTKQSNPFNVGDKVPEFKLPYATKDTVNFEGIGSASMEGKRYLLAFFPAAWSPGCTKEVCTFRDALSDLEKLNVMILAISGDYVFTLHEWAKHHNLNFTLLADHTRNFGRQMGIYNDQTGMFKRSVFVVGSDGKFQYIDYDYSVADQNDFNQLKEFLGQKK
jgi:peroxiredoxin